MTVRASNTTRANRARAAAEAAKTKGKPKRSLLDAAPEAGEPADDVRIEIDDSTLDERLPPAVPAPRRRAKAVEPEESDDEEIEDAAEPEEEEAPTKEFMALRLVKIGVDTFYRRGEQLDIPDKKLAAELLRKNSVVRVSDLPRYRRAG